MSEKVIGKQSGEAFQVRKGSLVEIVDVEGKQVADFFAVCAADTQETFSAGVTITKNKRHPLRPATGDVLYSNLYRPMFSIVADDVGMHDLLIPCCRPESYTSTQQEGHPSCLDNLNRAFADFGLGPFSAIQPLSIFMHTEVTPEQTLRFREPLSKAGDSIVFRAEMDIIVGVTACSDDISACNGGHCTPVKVILRGA